MPSDSPQNILTAFASIIRHPFASINPAKISSNRINNVGDALECYVKDAIAGLLEDSSVTDQKRDSIYNEIFSWLGNSGNPPDCIIKDGDAIEIKKIQTLTSDIALNSSYPKHKLYSNDTRVARGAKEAEVWTEKDIIYVVGSTSDNSELSRLFLIYGDCYAASKEVYEKLISAIETGVKSTPDVDFLPTNELGKVNKVDPLGITNMRIRGMWHISNPSRLYSDLVKKSPNRQFYLIMRESKYQSFSSQDRKFFEDCHLDGFSSQQVMIRNPDNPAQLVPARWIKYEI